MNHKPTIKGIDDGIWRRIRLIPYTVSFKDTADQTLEQQLRAELPGILAWAVRGADIRDADLRRVDLTGADLRRVDLRGADLIWTNLRKADLRGTDLKGADLHYAKLGSVNFHGAAYNDDTKFPKKFDPEKAGMVLVE